MMGKKPLDVVLTIFYINKVIQLGTFLTFYWYCIDFYSPFNAGFSWGAVTPLQAASESTQEQARVDWSAADRSAQR